MSIPPLLPHFLTFLFFEVYAIHFPSNKLSPHSSNMQIIKHLSFQIFLNHGHIGLPLLSPQLGVGLEIN